MRAAGFDEFMHAPVGRYVAGRSYVVWVNSPSLAGSAYFGRPDERDFPDILRLARLPEHPALVEGFDVVVDCGELEMLATPAFSVLLSYFRDVAILAKKPGQVSIVRPAGIAGTLVAGLFHDNVVPVFRSALFADRAEAFAWLGRADVGEARARIDDLMVELRGAPPPLCALRDLLAENPTRATLMTSARMLGLSERSLSRRLGELGTSFRLEVQRARLRAAEALLVDTDLKLDTIASRVGFASRAHFSDFFHRATGETPSDFRIRRR
jgi:AraC-like DNA-binding protein